MEEKKGRINRKFLVGKYVKPYLCLTLPLWLLESGAMWWLLRDGSAFCTMLCGALCLVVLPLAVLWYRLFRQWYPGGFGQVSVHVWLVCVALGVSAAWLAVGLEAMPAFGDWGKLLAVLPSLAVYGLGMAYVYFFGLRNETVYLLKDDLKRCPSPGWPLVLRTYLPAFAWCDLVLCALSLLYVLLLEYGWLPERYEELVILAFAVAYAIFSWRLTRLGRVMDTCGRHSYPAVLLKISGLLMLVTPMAAFSQQYAETVLLQLFSLAGYLNAFYFYEQKKAEEKKKGRSV